MKSNLTNPQGWNRYAYVRNNPLRYNDPTGKYTCEGSEAQCKNFEGALSIVRAAAAEAVRNHLRGTNRLTDIIKVYGELGKANGVRVAFGSLTRGAMQTGTDEKGQTKITVDAMRFGDHSLARDYLTIATQVAHEGDHAVSFAQDSAMRATWSRRDLSRMERSAYRSQGYAFSALGLDEPYGIWTRSPGQWHPDVVDDYTNLTVKGECETGNCTP